MTGRRNDAAIFNVRTCIGRADDLGADKSYYIVEVEAVLALMQASAQAAPHLFLFDELFPPLRCLGESSIWSGR
jgi:DNA mismatch repair ATPase MutS